MLFRFLGFATMSVTFLTIQAINSSETKSQLPPLTYEASSDIIVLEQGYDRNAANAVQYTNSVSAQKITDPFASKQSSVSPIAPKIMLASFGEVSLILPEVKTRKHHSYLPPIDFDIAHIQTGETSPAYYAPKPLHGASVAKVKTAALNSTAIIETSVTPKSIEPVTQLQKLINLKPVKVIKSPRKKYGVKKRKSYKKKYSRTKYKSKKTARKYKSSGKKRYSKNRGWKKTKYLTALN